MWTKGKIEKAWRVFDKSMTVIADALEVDVLELKALILEGTVPPYDRTETADPKPPKSINEAAVKRATLADLAPPAPEVVLEQAAPIIEKPLQFRPEPKRPPYVAPVSQPAPNAVEAVDVLIGHSLDEQPLPRRRSNVPTDAEDKRRANKPAEFYLMHDGKYLHESCTGLTDKQQHAWRQPEAKIAAVRRKFPDTIDYLEVRA